ncbi:CGNR zinc finger domain-containing protein [Nonomuraea sp. NBC_01738]|uniref:CGNR zinc finger domain-containing protein n=1 Tax=Nonomuraea sp. NBC_01738 TaxID=2976003 RepID=UPI002E0E21CB|nr:CGNR zinc finger domain-containing protein [Nonomuraea sp. NBC_01738]
MTAHTTRLMAERATALTAALLFGTPAATPASIDAVLDAFGEPPGAAVPEARLTHADVEEMRAAATRLLPVYAAESLEEAATLLNRILADVAKPPRLTAHGGSTGWHLHVDADDDGPWGEWLLASSAMALAVLLADHQRLPGGVCASAGCGRPYLGTGGGSPRRYCDTRCATRARVASHRARATR